MITKGSSHIGEFIYLRCENEFSDSIGDARQYSDSNGYMVFERCTVANATKGAGTWVVDEKETKLTCVSKTANYTAQPNELINCDISAGGFIVTLPTAPADKTRIHVKLNTIGLNQQLTLKTGGTDKFNEPTGNTEIYMYLFGSYAQMQYCAASGLWITFISAGTFNFATQFPGIDAVTPITENDVTFNATTGVLTIVPPLGYFNFYVNGNGIITRYRKVGTVNFPAITDTSGTWYFYFNNLGQPISTQVAWTGADFHTIAPVYRVLWNSTLVGTAKAVSEYIEWHLNTISAEDHIWKHAQGSIWLDGLNIFDNFLASGTPNADGRNTCISLSTGVVTDDNLPYRVVNDSTPTDFWEQDLGNITPASLNATNSGLFKIFVQDSAGRASFLPATRFPFAWDTATNRPQFITTTGVRTLVADNRWFVYFLYATQNPKTGEAIRLVSSATEYTSLANAQAVTWGTIQSLYPTLFNDTEIRPLYKLIFYNNHLGAFPAGAKYTALREKQDIRKAAVTSTTTAAGSIAASAVTLVPVGGVSSTNVQAAIQELDSDITLKTTDMDSAEFSGEIDETNDKFTIYDFSLLKWIRFSFTSLKSYLKTYFDNIYELKKGTDDNYVTDAEKIVIGNTSGTNTGDQDLSGLQPINLVFTDTEVLTGSFVADTTYATYGYKCDLELTGVTSTMIAEVIYAHAEAISGNYSPIAVTGAGIVTIYSKVNTTITIPTILINK